MKPNTNHSLTPIILMALVLAGALFLAACGSPTPIAVYVTPTPLPDNVSEQVDQDPVQDRPVAESVEGGVVDAAVALQVTITPPPPTQSGGFGPLIGPNYTLEPLATPLPDNVSVQACSARVAVPELAIYAQPDTTSPLVRMAISREMLVIREIPDPNARPQWARGDEGWFMLADANTSLVEMREVRACEILLGQQPDTTLMGLHVLNGTQTEAALNLVRRLAAAGHPMSTIKGLNGTEQMLNQVKEISPQTITVYRSLLSADGERDCPNDVYSGVYPDPVAEAQRWMAGLEPYWSQVNPDYFEFMNECPAPLDWIAQFSIEAMRIANEDGRCLLLFSLPGGTPNMAEFDQLLPAYQYALEHPCASGRMHGIALHAYSLEDNVLTSESNVHIALRHRVLEERLLRVLPEAADLPVFITEFGIGGGTIMPSCEMIITDVLQYTYQLEEDPYVEGFHLWNLGYGAQWYDITPCLPELGDHLIAYYNGGS